LIIVIVFTMESKWYVSIIFWYHCFVTKFGRYFYRRVFTSVFFVCLSMIHAIESVFVMKSMIRFPFQI